MTDQPPVDEEGLPGDERGVVGHEERDGSGEVVGHLDPLDRLHLRDDVEERGRSGLGGPGAYQAGSDGVDGDAGVGELGGRPRVSPMTAILLAM
jgi:hypothetical protein